MSASANRLGWPAWAWAVLLTIALAYGMFSVVGSLSNFARAGGLFHDLNPTELTLGQPHGTPPGWSRVLEVRPGGGASAAGLRAGDLVRFDTFADHLAVSRVGSHPVTVERDGTRFRAKIAVRAAEPPDVPVPPGVLVLFGVGGLATTALGALLLIRGRNNRAAVMLGVLLAVYGMVAVRLPPWAPGLATSQLFSLGIALNYPVIAFFKLLFALEISGGAAIRRQARLVLSATVVLTFLSLAVSIAILVPMSVPLLGPGFAAQAALSLVNNALVFGVIALNYRGNDAPARNRIKIVATALALYLLSIQVRAASGLFVGGAMPLGIAIGTSLLEFTGLALLAYAVLRQKLFDLNFVLNRALVYGAVSFILLAAFGLAEWSVEHLVPEAWREGGPFISAGIALALFLSFHRLRNWVERHVERLLFSSWHRNEATLRRFIAAADHFGSTAALQKAFAAELSRFAAEANVALYLRGAGGGYELQAGKLAKAGRRYADDDRALALMRAERRPVDIGQAHSALPGTLALPMLDQGALLGFALLGPKPDGTHYRPDEIEVLGWAAQQVGFAAQAQQVRQLEATIAELRAQVAALSGPRSRRTAAATA